MGEMDHVVKTDLSQKTWVILGAKRTGTSFLAELLGNNGIEIATCGNLHNEDLDFVMLNDLILHSVGGDWNNLPPDELIGVSVKAHEQEIKALIASKKESGRDWGWKCPRQGATIKYILPYLDDDVYLVAVFRKPDIAARSMQRTWAHMGYSFDFCRKAITDMQARIIDALGEFTK